MGCALHKEKFCTPNIVLLGVTDTPAEASAGHAGSLARADPIQATQPTGPTYPPFFLPYPHAERHNHNSPSLLPVSHLRLAHAGDGRRPTTLPSPPLWPNVVTPEIAAA